jgi:hypothetical protein
MVFKISVALKDMFYELFSSPTLIFSCMGQQATISFEPCSIKNCLENNWARKAHVYMKVGP